MRVTSRTPRIHVDQPLGPGQTVELGREQTHYLTRVMRLGAGAPVRLFNATDGEWQARIASADKRSVSLAVEDRLARPDSLPDIDYLFAPLKAARLDYLVQKATEMGVRRLRPVITAHTVGQRFNPDRARANIVEAAEQCNLLALPELVEAAPLETVLDEWDARRRLIYCDEAAAGTAPLPVLSALEPGPLAVLVGPEGGFSPQERDRLRGLDFVTPISLGPRIMRADTAAVAALALVQAALGDWPRHQPG